MAQTVLTVNTKRDHGRKAQSGNIAAGKVRSEGRLGNALHRVRPAEPPANLFAPSTVNDLYTVAGGRRHHPHDAWATLNAENAPGREWRCFDTSVHTLSFSMPRCPLLPLQPTPMPAQAS